MNGSIIVARPILREQVPLQTVLDLTLIIAIGFMGGAFSGELRRALRYSTRLIAQLRADHAPPLMRGDEIAEATGARGAEIKRLVDMLAEEQAAGSVATREEALAYVREQVR